MEGIETKHFIIFGDLNIASFTKKTYLKKDGEEYIMFLIKPSDRIRRHYDMKKTEVDENTGMVVKMYPKRYVMAKSEEPDRTFILLECNFEGDQTELSSRYVVHQKQIEALQKQVNTLNGGIAYLQQEYDKALTLPLMFIKNQSELSMEARRAGKRISSESEEADDYAENE